MSLSCESGTIDGIAIFVTARLSENEFVMTADAVRAAGGGSVQKGAKKMYDTMKQLEQQPEAKGAMA